MAEGLCSSRRVRLGLLALVIVCVVVVIVAVAVYFSTREDDDDGGGGNDSGGSGGSNQKGETNGSSKIYRLPSSLHPLHYDLELLPDIYQPNPSNFSLSGRVVIRVLCQEVTSVVVLHAAGSVRLSRDGMRVTSEGNGSGVADVNVKRFEMNPSQETVSLYLDGSLKATYRYLIHLSFRAPLTERFQAAYYSTYKEQGQTKYLASTIFVPVYARMAFPCFDEPAMKAEFTLTLLRKPDFVALSNMPLSISKSRTERGEDWIADMFQTSPAMSTYLFTYTVCQFLSQQVNTTHGYTFKAWSRPASVLQTQYALEVGSKVMPFFDDYFGIRFPLPQQEMIALPEYQYGGMEHWGLVGYKERLLLYSNALPSALDRQTIATIIAHELGHMWFGDLLTMVWWDDTWLNEGFATYTEYLGVDFAFPQWKMMEQFLVLTFRSAMQLDAFQQSRPLYTPVVVPSDILSAYDSIIYSKGASVIRMVKSFLGERPFKRGIQKYLQKFKYGSATHQDLWHSLHQEAEKANLRVNVSDVMHSWTVQNNFPVVMVTRKQKGQLLVRQQRFLLKGSVSDQDTYQWDIPFTFATNANHQPDRDVSPNDVIWISRHEREHTIVNESIAGPEEEEGWLLGNLGYYGYYRVNYEESNWRALINQLKKNHSRISLANRAQILMDSWSLAKAGQLNYTIALSTLGYLQKETQYVPWRAALAELRDLKALLSANLTVFQQFSVFMQRQTTAVFADFDPNVALVEDLDARTAAMVGQAACSYDLRVCVTMAKEQFDRWMRQPHNNTITVDMRSSIYCTAVGHGNRSTWNFVFQRFSQEATASERARLRLALTCSRDPDILNTLINRTLDASYIREQDALSTLIACAGNRYGRDLVWQFVQRNVPVIKEKFGTTAFNLKNLFSGISSSFYTDQHLQQLQDLAKKYPDVAESMTDAIETTRANRKWIQQNMASVEQWLIQQNDMAAASGAAQG